MITETATNSVADEPMRLSAPEVAIAPRAMFSTSTSAFPMMRGPMVAYSADEPSAAAESADPAPEAEAATAEVSTDQDDPDREAAGDDEGEGEPADPDAEGQAGDDTEEVEYEGAKYTVPKPLKDALLRQADYTQKTQALAEAKRAFDAETATARATAQQEAQTLLTEIQEEVGKVHVLKTQLAAFEAVDWDVAWEEASKAENPGQASNEVSRAYARFQKLQADATAAAAALDKKKTELATASEQATANRMKEVGETLAREVPGWSRETAGKLVETGKEFGFELSDFSVMDDPRAWKAFHALHASRAEVADLKAQLAGKTKAAAHVAAQTTTPAKTVSGAKPAASGLDDRNNIDAWMERRNAQVAKARR